MELKVLQIATDSQENDKFSLIITLVRFDHIPCAEENIADKVFDKMPERRCCSSMHQRCFLAVFFMTLLYIVVIDVVCATENFTGLTCIDTEIQTLVAFKQGLTDPSGRLSSWAGLNCCQWHGIACHNTSRHVIKLDLRNPFPGGIGNLSCLGGEISSSLVGLRYLEYLDLSLNDFEGVEIPQSIGMLENLRYLNLSMASFAGKVPPNLGNLSNLRYLDLNSNSLVNPRTYELVTENLQWLSRLSFLKHLNMGRVKIKNVGSEWVEAINMLPSLVELHLRSCNLQRIPPLLPFVNFTSLSVLDLSGNSFNSSIPNWLNLPSLRYLDLGMNTFNGAVPGTFANLTALEYLDLSSNGGINGQIPGFLGNFCELKVLNLSGNALGGGVDALFGGFSSCPKNSLVSLDLSDNDLMSKLPDSPMNCLLSLQEVDISFNKMNGMIPSYLNEIMPRVKYLFLSGNRFHGTIPSSICSMRSLQVLSLRNNQLTGSLPNCWNQSQPLWVLDVANNNISGAIPASIGLLTSLNMLMLANNRLVGEIPRTLQNCTGLVSIDFGENRLSGKLPLWIGESGTAFWIIRLRSNSFSGTIPTSWCNLSVLHILDLAHNNLSGGIPTCFGNLTSLTYDNSSNVYRNLFWAHKYYYVEQTIVVSKGRELEYSGTLQYVNSIDLSGNNLAGGIPGGITSLTALGTLNLSMNRLTGNIPGDIGKIRWLETLDLSNNNLSGSIPPSISSLTLLNYLNLSHNNLEGRIPMGRQLQTLNDSSIYQGNPLLCGVFLQRKCPGDGELERDGGEENDDDSEMVWFYVSMGCGFLVGVFGVSCCLWIKESWRIAYLRFLRVI